MLQKRILAFAVILAAAVTAGHAHAVQPAGATRGDVHFDIINATFDSVTRIAVAPPGGTTFRDINIGPPLQGGFNRLTLDMPSGDCLRDLRVTFRNGRVLYLPDIDVCRSTGLRLTAR